MNTSMYKSFKQFAMPILGGVLAIIAIIFYYTSAKDTATQSAPQPAKNNASVKSALTVNIIKPQLINLPDTVPALGSISAWQEAIIGAEVSGLLLKEVLVNVGDSVKKGQIIARFSSSNIDADIAQARANLAEAKAAAIEAESNANRARSIQNTGAISAQQIEQYVTAETSAKARVESALASLSGQQVKLRQTVVLAPDSGIISARSATVGAVISSGQELFKLIRQGRLEWRAELTSADISKVKVGMTAQLILPDGSALQGKVRAFSPSVDTQTRNALVYVDVPNQGAKAGMFARGQFTLSDSPALTLPNSAIVMREGFAYIMQLENQHVKQLKVGLGRRLGDAVEVKNLPDENASFVASGAAFLLDGDVVKVVETAQVVKE